MVGRKKGWLAYRGKFAALKSNGTVLWKSTVVRDYLYLLEFYTDVLSYENCRLEVHYTHAGESHILIPELRVRRKDSLQLVKIVSGWEQTEGREGLCLPGGLSRVEGYDLTILTESEVRQQPFLNNVKGLWRYARVPVEAPQYQLLCHDFFKSRGCAPLGELTEFFTRRHLSAAHVFALIFHGMLFVDMTSPLTRRSSVSYTDAGAALQKGA
jgi:hypothetical protein